MPIVAAIDTGGTKIVGAAVDEKGNILKEIRIPQYRKKRFLYYGYLSKADLGTGQ